MTIFLVGTIISAVAPNFTLLLIGRLIKGGAVGITISLVPNVLALIFLLATEGP